MVHNWALSTTDVPLNFYSKTKHLLKYKIHTKCTKDVPLMAPPPQQRKVQFSTFISESMPYTIQIGQTKKKA